MPDASGSAKIVVRDLVKRYGTVEAVRGVSFEVAAGTVCGLLGPNGAGKTSVLECLLGLRVPEGGSIWLNGIDALAQPERAKARVGATLQSTALQDRLTPRETLELFGAFYPAPVSVGELLVRFGLIEKADAPFETLSAGQRQRLALALACVQGPDILCFDEPTAGLDAQSRRDLHGFIRDLRAEGRTVLLTTHDLVEAHALCDQIVVLDAGRVVACGPPAKLVAQSRVRSRILLRVAAPLPAGALCALPEISSVEIDGTQVRLDVEHVGPAIVAVVRWLDTHGGKLLDLRVLQPSLEDAVLELTSGLPMFAAR